MALIRGNFFIQGTTLADQIFGGNYSDYINAGGGDDVIFGGGGNDVIDGGSGRDTAEFDLEFFRSSITRNPVQYLVSGPEGIDILSNIEALKFRNLEIDIVGAIRSTLTGGGLFNPETILTVSGISVAASDIPSSSRFSLQADGSIMNTVVRTGLISIGDILGDDRGAGLLFQINSDQGLLQLNTAWDADQQVRLGNLDDLAFDYFIAGAGRTDLIPEIRLLIDADGNLLTRGDRGELIFEWGKQGFGATTTFSWQHADLAGDDWIAWQRVQGVDLDQAANLTRLSDWSGANGFMPAGGLHFDQNSLVLAWTLAVGPDAGIFAAVVDNLQVGPVTYDFDFA